MKYTLSRYKRLAGLPSSAKDFVGMSYMCIHRMITDAAELGYEGGDITKGQKNQLIDWRDRVLDSIRF
tara:strand:- start:224 stop:427 length:204 start_codon:yes stop_codon:yes gene_type:complete